MSDLKQFEKDSFSKDTLALHVFSDTLSDKGDFDAEITTDYRHLRPRDTRHGIGDSLTRGAYGVELIDQLAGNAKNEIPKKIKEGTIRVIANSAPRIDANENGENFYLAITKNGLEILATPLDVLTYVRDKVVSLFEIPNEGNPLFNGKREQFRSSIIARAHEHPEHLKRVNPDIIPEQKNDLEIAYIDEFGNLRLRAKSTASIARNIEELLEDGEVTLNIEGIRETVVASVVSCLDEIKEGEFGLYRNVADGEDAGYWELVRKWKSNGEKLNAHEDIGKPKIGLKIEIVKKRNMKI